MSWDRDDVPLWFKLLTLSVVLVSLVITAYKGRHTESPLQPTVECVKGGGEETK